MKLMRRQYGVGGFPLGKSNENSNGKPIRIDEIPQGSFTGISIKA